jgi:hypothetical protein
LIQKVLVVEELLTVLGRPIHFDREKKESFRRRPNN